MRRATAIFFLTLLVWTAETSCCSAISNELSLEGKLFYRYQAEENFKKVENGACPTGSFYLLAAPDTLFPMATGSSIQNASFSIILYPGALLNVDSGKLRLLGGRIQVKSEEPLQEPIKFVDSRFVIQFYQGEMLFEMTPLRHAWLAMIKTGEGWLKDRSRRVVVLQPGTEIEIPLFGETVVKERIGSRWQKAPEVAVVEDVAAVFSDKPPENELASKTSILEEETAETEEAAEASATEEVEDSKESKESREAKEPEESVEPEKIQEAQESKEAGLTELPVEKSLPEKGIQTEAIDSIQAPKVASTSAKIEELSDNR